MPRGGARTGSPGTPYANRSDLRQPVTVPSAAQYGDRQAAMAQQSAIPLPRNVGAQLAGQGPPAAPPPGAGPPGEPQSAPQGVPPGPGLRDPTARPNEPVTAGLASGPGEGPSPMMWNDPELHAIRVLYAAHPSEDLRRLIQRWGS